MKYIEDLMNIEEILNYDVFIIELQETAILTPWGEKRNLFFLLDDYFAEKADCNLIYHDIRSDVDSMDINASTNIKKKELKERYFINDRLVDELFEEEKKNIVRYSSAREYVYRIYTDIINNKKKVLFLVEDGIDRQLAEAILTQCGYGVREGVIYKHDIYSGLDKYVLDNEEVLFIGRELIGDLDNCGYIFIPETRYVLEGGYNRNIINRQAVIRAAGNLIHFPNVVKTPGYAIMEQLIANKFFDNPNVDWKIGTEFNADAYFLGYSALGMHIAGIIKWLSECLYSKSCSQILFCARDGFLIKQAYDYYCIYNQDLPKSEYIQGSRKLLLPVLLKNRSDFYNIPGVMFQFYSPHKIMLLLWRFSNIQPSYDFNHETYDVYESEVKDKIERAGFHYDENFNEKKRLNDFISFYLETFYDEDKHIKLKRDVQDYYKSYSTGTAIFDAGYSGKLPHAIIECSSGIRDVFYLYTDDENAEVMKRIGNFSIERFYDFRPMVDNVLREYIISENAPSCVGIMRENGKLNPVFEIGNEEYCKSDAIQEIQRGALDFIKDLYDKFQENWKCIPFRASDVSLPFEGFIREITDGDLDIFVNTYQEDYHTGKADSVNWGAYYKDIMGAFPNAFISGEVHDRKMSKDNLKISVVITTYNRKYEVARALRSVCAQSILPYEIIIVDDGSTDGTREYLESHVQGTYKYIYNVNSKGPGRSRNIGIIASSGDYIAFLDSDNEWYPNKLECFIDAIKEAELPDVICSKYYKHIGFDKYILPGMPAENDLPLDIEILLHNFADASASMYKKNFLEKLDGFSETMLTNIDWEILLRAYKKGEISVYRLQEVLSENWIMDDSMTSQVEVELRERLELLDKYCSNLKNGSIKALFYKQFAYDHTELCNENDKRNLFFRWVGYTPMWMECAYEFSDGVINSLLCKISECEQEVRELKKQIGKIKE